MLQRAASNAYTWWWASHIRTNQSKWLDNDLQEMEERVKSMIKLIDEDADSFAKKAEMYFRRRPELINCVEEAYRAYKALADKYDRISGELHRANHTIATAFPDQVPMIDDDDEDDNPHRTFSSINPDKLPNPPPDAAKLPKPPPELPRHSSRVRRAEAQPSDLKKPKHRRDNSNVNPEKAQEEIDRLQKSILVLQTQKEFFKGSYEKGLAKYWDIERQMTEMQEEISRLQDDFNVGNVIEDDEARALMAATALKSCEDTLVGLHAQHKESVGEARLESERILAAKSIYRSLKGEVAAKSSDQDEAISWTVNEDQVESLNRERLESICDKVKGLFEMSSESSVGELVEKIDSLVEKIISLEITVSTQAAQILALRAETDELHTHLRGVEEDKKNSNVDPSSLNERLTQVEGQLQRILDLERSVHNEKGVVQSHFAEACHSLNNLSEKLQSPTRKDQLDTNTEPFIESKGFEELDKDIKETKENSAEIVHKKIEEAAANPTEKVHNHEVTEKVEEKSENGSIDQKEVDKDENDPKWQGRDNILLYEYSSLIRNYKETRERLADIEKKNQECHSETMQQIQELRCANAIKDEEIKTLRKNLFSAESLRSSSQKKATAAHEPPSNQENSPRLQDLIADAFVGSELDPPTEEEAKICNLDRSFTTSPLEDKFRADIDALMEENLDFWLRFSTSYHQIQKFSLTFKELQAEAEKFIETKSEDSPIESASIDQTAVRPDSMPTDKKLRELNTEIQVWLEHNGHLQGELSSRFASLCSIQEEITRVAESRDGENEDAKFTPYQAAKFQGEVINMQQENNKVAKELQAGLDHVKGIQTEVGKTLSKLRERFEPSSSKAPQYNQFRHISTRSRVPLKTFLFAAKPKKPSIFACMNPVYHHHQKNLDMKSGKMHKASH